MTLGCGHEGIAAGETCEHLPTQPAGGYIRCFTGKGWHHRLCCMTCRTAEAPSWRDACAACLQKVENEDCWEGIEGQPEVMERASGLTFAHAAVALPGLRADEMIDIRALATAGCWMALDTRGQLWHADFHQQKATLLRARWPEDIGPVEALELHVSADGRFAAIVQCVGSHGVVFDLANDEVSSATMRLARGDYHCDVSPFSIAFFIHEGRTLLVHPTDWNRLDISDPATGELLTPRISPNNGDAHFLDYFHGRLLASPDGHWVAEDGWVWSPTGYPRAWSLREWVTRNPWESEDGQSLQSMPWRAYRWSDPMCWTGAHVLAVWGYGEDDQWMIPAVTLYDVRSGEALRRFAGPETAAAEGTDWRAAIARPGGALVFDQHLFACSERFGISVWDIADGVCLHRDATLKPLRHHAIDHVFLSAQPDGFFRLSRLEGAAP
ncbi:hypothetical protein [Variovorax sp. EL159]|uniref:hypothetical protein n=1 Tax=Variovorax sp. EL159 TaxID=1566270 RepID=UPI0008859117|nr:hypothetical protein [Variovorax sp. EL159]SCX73748.1 hypothetical protein SAMN03159363_5480 [Variovorax sp. EL159]